MPRIIQGARTRGRISAARRRIAGATLLAAAWALTMTPPSAVAAEPLGFEGFAFGTTRSALLAEPIFQAHCHPAPETEAGVWSRASRVDCPTYDLNDLGALHVTLLFSAEARLTGYVVYIPRERTRDVRAAIESLYGPPTKEVEQGRTIAWHWPSGAEASMTILCRGLDGCLTVKSKGPEKR